jgi:hypothetical protein
MIGLLILMRRRLSGLEGKRVFTGAAKAGVATLAMSLVLWGWLNWMGTQPAWLLGGAGVLIGGAVYGLAALSVGLEEARKLLGILGERLG